MTTSRRNRVWEREGGEEGGHLYLVLLRSYGLHKDGLRGSGSRSISGVKKGRTGSKDRLQYQKRVLSIYKPKWRRDSKAW